MQTTSRTVRAYGCTRYLHRISPANCHVGRSWQDATLDAHVEMRWWFSPNEGLRSRVWDRTPKGDAVAAPFQKVLPNDLTWSTCYLLFSQKCTQVASTTWLRAEILRSHDRHASGRSHQSAKLKGREAESSTCAFVIKCVLLNTC